jgi:hypothetical protein
VEFGGLNIGRGETVVAGEWWRRGADPGGSGDGSAHWWSDVPDESDEDSEDSTERGETESGSGGGPTVPARDAWWRGPTGSREESPPGGYRGGGSGPGGPPGGGAGLGPAGSGRRKVLVAIAGVVALAAGGIALGVGLGGSSGSGSSGAPAPVVRVGALPPAQPRDTNGTPVLLSPGPARDQYLETLRQQLDVVKSPPTRVTLVGTIVSVSPTEVVVTPPSAPAPPGGNVVGGESIFPDFGGAPVHAIVDRGTNFLVAHNSVAALAPGKPIAILGIRQPDGFHAVLVTDFSGVRPPTANQVAKSQPHAELVSNHSASTRTRTAARQVSLNSSDARQSGETPSANLLASGSEGLDGINLSLSGVNWGDVGTGCPYFALNAQLVAGLGDEWNFPLNLSTTPDNKLAVQSLAHGMGTGPSLNINIGHFSQDTFYSAFGFGASASLELGCKVTLPVVDLGFLGKHGGESIGPDFTVGKDLKFLMSNVTQDATPLWGQQALTVPATDCEDFSTDGFPGIGDLLKTIHGPSADFELCPQETLLPAGFRGTTHDPQSRAHGFALGKADTANIGFDPSQAQTVHVDTFNFAPQLRTQLAAGINFSLTHDRSSEDQPQKKSDVPPLATGHCNDGTYSFSQHSRGSCSGHGGIGTKLVPAGATAHCNDDTYSFAQNSQGSCSSHGGIAEKLDPSQEQAASTSPQPSPIYKDFVEGHLDVGPFTVPFFDTNRSLSTSTDPSALDLPLHQGPTPPKTQQTQPPTTQPPAPVASCPTDQASMVNATSASGMTPTGFNQYTDPSTGKLWAYFQADLGGESAWTQFIVSCDPSSSNPSWTQINVLASTNSNGPVPRNLACDDDTNPAVPGYVPANVLAALNVSC